MLATTRAPVCSSPGRSSRSQAATPGPWRPDGVEHPGAASGAGGAPGCRPTANAASDLTTTAPSSAEVHVGRQLGPVAGGARRRHHRVGQGHRADAHGHVRRFDRRDLSGGGGRPSLPAPVTGRGAPGASGRSGRPGPARCRPCTAASAASTVVTALTRWTVAARRIDRPSARGPLPRGVLTTKLISPSAMRSTALDPVPSDTLSTTWSTGRPKRARNSAVPRVAATPRPSARSRLRHHQAGRLVPVGQRQEHHAAAGQLRARGQDRRAHAARCRRPQYRRRRGRRRRLRVDGRVRRDDAPTERRRSSRPSSTRRPAGYPSSRRPVPADRPRQSTSRGRRSQTERRVADGGDPVLRAADPRRDPATTCGPSRTPVGSR